MNQSKQKIIIVCGGMSGEHEVSLNSATNVFNNIDRTLFSPELVGITKKGAFVRSPELILNPGDPKKIKLNPDAEVIDPFLEWRNNPPDAVFPVMHGTYCEDGTIQGILNFLRIPFCGAGILGSAASMDKEAAKNLMREAGIPVNDHIIIKAGSLPNFSEVTAKLGNTVFVKPASLGSSVGVFKCKTEEEFKASISEAFEFDRKLLVEPFFKGREIEFGLMGNEDIICSPPGEIFPDREFYDYDSKYDSTSTTKTVVPADVASNVAKSMRETAIKAYVACFCEGFARIDFFLAEDGRFVVNEINTLPGFTKISMFPVLMSKTGFEYSSLITRIIELAISRQNQINVLKTDFLP